MRPTWTVSWKSFRDDVGTRHHCPLLQNRVSTVHRPRTTLHKDDFLDLTMSTSRTPGAKPITTEAGHSPLVQQLQERAIEFGFPSQYSSVFSAGSLARCFSSWSRNCQSSCYLSEHHYCVYNGHLTQSVPTRVERGGLTGVSFRSAAADVIMVTVSTEMQPPVWSKVSRRTAATMDMRSPCLQAIKLTASIPREDTHPICVRSMVAYNSNLRLS
jgi:hypothetical protein